jgi:hypothetical protein
MIPTMRNRTKSRRGKTTNGLPARSPKTRNQASRAIRNRRTNLAIRNLLARKANLKRDSRGKKASRASRANRIQTSNLRTRIKIKTSHRIPLASGSRRLSRKWNKPA